MNESPRRPQPERSQGRPSLDDRAEPRAGRGGRRALALALGYGLTCHGTFALAIALMVADLHQGMRFGLGALTGATAWAVDLRLVAAVWTTYCVLGPRHKERCYATIHGAAFDAHRRRVPHLIPRFAR